MRSTIRKLALGWLVLMSLWLVPMSSAQAATQGANGEQLQLTPGQLLVGSVGLGDLNAEVDESVQGTYPSAVWSDTTGSGAGWQGSIALSQAIYTGGWNPQSGAPSLGSNRGGGYTGGNDGLQVVVSTTSSSGTITSFTWVDNLGNSGSGTATNGQACNIEDGLSVNFAPNTAYANGDKYGLDAGSQPTQAVQLLTSVGSVISQLGVYSPPPQLINSGVVLQAGNYGSYGPAVPFVSAGQLQSMGAYTVSPGVQVTVDSSAWQAVYVAQAEYTIPSGPGS